VLIAYVAEAFGSDKHVMSQMVSRAQSRTEIRMLWFICPRWFI